MRKGEHNFYVTQFPMTPRQDFPKATEILYLILKYLGAIELNKGWVASNIRSSLWIRCQRKNLQEIDQLKHQSLEIIFQSSEGNASNCTMSGKIIVLKNFPLALFSALCDFCPIVKRLKSYFKIN
jgi:hypothetical protein